MEKKAAAASYFAVVVLLSTLFCSLRLANATPSLTLAKRDAATLSMESTLSGLARQP